MQSGTTTGRSTSLARRLLARFGLVLAGLLAGVLVLVGAEVVLRVFGAGQESLQRDPFGGFSHVVPMFVPAVREDGTRVYRLSLAREIGAIGRPKDEPQREFLADKPPGAYRIFIMGDSSAAGVPYTTAYAFSSWLARRLAAELPDVRFDVVNAAMPGYASRRLMVVAEELAAYAPDLVIIYVGHNEYAERRYYAHLLDMDPRLFRLQEWLAETRVWGVLSNLWVRAGGRPEDRPRFDFDTVNDRKEMFAVLNKRASGNGYATAREREYGELMYRFNLETIVRTLQQAGARVMLLTLSQNFAGWAPGASEHRPGLSASDLDAWERHVAEGRHLANDAHDCTGALVAYGQALAIDDSYADLVFRVAACEEALGRFDDARAHYRRASDLDRVPHGAPTHFNDVIRDVARAQGALLADVDPSITAASLHGLVGDDLFTDWVHPNIRAHQIIAATVAEAMRQAGVPEPAAKWTDGGYTDPDPDTLYAADRMLHISEHAARMGTCLLAHRKEEALAEIDAIIAADPANPGWLKTREEVLRQAATWD